MYFKLYAVLNEHETLSDFSSLGGFKQTIKTPKIVDNILLRNIN